ncbi:MAG: hypothetical protein Q8910_00170 [Bacteroidota bacterium]|nr:hypothetical protein [Bacteroidota bacterium]
MKTGLYYEDKFTKELYRCDNFTRSCYVWQDKNGKIINEDKLQAWKHMNPIAIKSKKRIREFEGS